jgi:ABC-type Mn2+/Zn2+ transport system permease subunit
LAAILFVLVFASLFKVLNWITLLTAQEDLAHISGVPVRLVNYGFVFLLTLAVAISIRLLGILLVTSLMVIPPAAARNLSRSLRQQIISSVMIGALASCGGILLAYPLDFSSGPAIVMVSILIFLVTLVFSKLGWRKVRGT